MIIIPPMRLNSELDIASSDAHLAIYRIHAMTNQEQHYRLWDSDGDSREASSFYGTSDLPLSEQSVDSQSRKMMCNWCYQVVDYFNFSRETVQIGMSYFDRFLITQQGRLCKDDRSHYQLACITCMYVAIKVNEQMDLHASLLCQLSRGCYTVSQITRMERVILESLQWRLNPPTATAFVQHFVALLPTTLPIDERRRLLNIAMYQAELALFDHSFITATAASTIAAAAVSNALESVASTEYQLSIKLTTIMDDMQSIVGTPSGIAGLRDCQAQLLRCFQESNGKSMSVSCSGTSLVTRTCALKGLDGSLSLSVSP
jgi:hypothetical protein